MRWLFAFLVVGSLGLSAGAAYFFLGTPKEDPAVRRAAEVQKNIARLLPAAEKDSANAQYALARVYRYDSGPPPNALAAVKWFTRAAKKGHAGAQFELGQMYARGEGVARNYHRAAEWFRLAAKLSGHLEAQFELGQLHFHGRGVVHSYGTAIEYFDKAAARGHPVAQYVLGTIYEGGWGVKKDLIEAYKWAALAAPHAKRIVAADPKFTPVKILERVKRAMNRSQLEAGEKAVRAWKVK